MMIPKTTVGVALLVGCLLLVRCGTGSDETGTAPDAADALDLGIELIDSISEDLGVESVDAHEQVEPVPDLVDLSPDEADTCVPDGAGGEYGDDESGGTCWDCADGETDSVDACDSETGDFVQCWPDCDDKFCGSDGCGGSCGECPADPCFDMCLDGMCQPSNAGPEECDGIDNNCDGVTDEGFSDWDSDDLADCVDPDDDNDGDPDDTDCEPLDPSSNHFAFEQCDCVDNNCNGIKDEGFPDLDGDGCCDADDDLDGDGDPDASDCAVDNPDIFHGAFEECDGEDNNCSGQVDEGYPDTNLNGIPDCMETGPCFFIPGEGPDEDCDGYGDLVDCEPLNGEVHPGAQEICDEIDNDCSGVVDDDCVCVPDCWWQECGDDGCGGSCGECDDGDECTDDSCDDIQKFCVHTTVDCDDDEACTADSCDPGSGCAHETLEDNSCTYAVEYMDMTICELPGVCGENGCIPKPNCECPDCDLCVCCSLPVLGTVQICMDNLL